MRHGVLRLSQNEPMKTPLIALLAIAVFLETQACTGQKISDNRTVTEQPRDRVLNVPVLKPVEFPPTEKLDQSIDRGIAFLLKVQNKNGSWGSATRTKGINIYAPVPGAHHAFRTAVTAMCVSALIGTSSDQKNVEQSIDRGAKWMFDWVPKLRRATPDTIYNTWGHIYSIQALVRLHGLRFTDNEKKQRIRGLITSQIEMLERFESIDGGWGYYDFRIGAKKPSSSSLSFVSAAALVALHKAKTLGVHASHKVVERALASIKRQQKPDFSYLYGEYLKWQPMLGINRPGGSLGRSQACNIALRLWNDETITDDVLKMWLNRLFARNGWLNIGRKRPIPHESWFQVAGYFYYFGHYYAALCLEQLNPADRPTFQAHLAVLMLKRQEKDGSWWDYPLYNYHQQYGTALALMTLYRCQQPSAKLIRSPQRK